MIEKDKSSSNTKAHTGHSKQREYSKVTKVMKEKEEITKNGKQENNKHITPSSTKESVAINEISDLLKTANNKSKQNKSNENKENEERIREIVEKISKKLSQNEMPTKSKEELENKPTLSKEDKSEEVFNSLTIEKSTPTQNNTSSNVFLNSLLFITVLAVGYLVYDKNIQEKPTFIDLEQNIQERYVLKDKQQTPLDELKFNNLPNDIQDKYILKKEILKIKQYTNLIIKKSQSLEIKNEALTKQVDALKIKNINGTQNIKLVNGNKRLLLQNKRLKKEQELYTNKLVASKIARTNDKKQIDKLLLEKVQLAKEIKKTKVLKKEAQVNTLNTSTKDYSDIIKQELFPATKSTSKNFKIVKCYDVPAASFYLSQTCKRDITKFLKTNKKAKRFEIIGVVDEKDISLLSGQKKTKEELKKYVTMGIARYRVLETSWLITEVLGKDIVLSPVNYTITSKKNNRGSIIRAHY